MRRAAAGDEEALARLIADHHDPMIKVAYVIVGDADLARDAAQTAWTVAWRRLRDLRDPERIRPWLVAIAANEARQLIRRELRRTVVELSAGSPERMTSHSGHGRDPQARPVHLARRPSHQLPRLG